jgi:predicted TIM-barrel fold metal-dependent hydrolase
MESLKPELGGTPKPVDMHVHLVGNGLTGSGCWLRVSGWHRPLAGYMLRHIGLRSVALGESGFDELYVANLVRLVRQSSLGQIVILAHDQVYGDDGKVMNGAGSFYVPNEWVLKLAREYSEFIPAVSIHPARRDALDELDRCIEQGAAMMKCLPNCHNIDCSLPGYTPFWDRMAAARLPLLAHTGGEHTVPVIRPEFSNPEILRRPLESGVTVIAAHCATKSGFADKEYFHTFVEMTRKYPNFYGDNSAFSTPIRGRHSRKCLAEPLASRILHGSDYPVPVLPHWALLQRLIGWRDFMRCNRIKNPLERDYQLKKAIGFAPDSFTRIRQLLRPTNTEKIAFATAGNPRL